MPDRWYGCPLCGRSARSSRELTAQGCEGKHVELIPAEEAEGLRRDLAECYRLSGEDPDGAPDSMIAQHAVEAVRTLREQSDANNLEELELREKAEQKLEKIKLSAAVWEKNAIEDGWVLAERIGSILAERCE